MSWIFDFLAALITASLAGMGVGGGGLLVLWLIFVTGTDQLSAQGINIIFYIFASSASLFVHIKNRKLPVAAIITLALFGAAGAVGGCILAEAIKAELLRRLFGGLLAAAGAFVLFKKGK